MPSSILRIHCMTLVANTASKPESVHIDELPEHAGAGIVYENIEVFDGLKNFAISAVPPENRPSPRKFTEDPQG